jgi:hypothetical protein
LNSLSSSFSSSVLATFFFLLAFSEDCWEGAKLEKEEEKEEGNEEEENNVEEVEVEEEEEEEETEVELCMVSTTGKTMREIHISQREGR